MRTWTHQNSASRFSERSKLIDEQRRRLLPLALFPKPSFQSAAAGTRHPLSLETAENRCPGRLFGGAGRWIPAVIVGLALEMGAGDERLGEVLRILDDGGDDEPGIAVRLVGPRVVFSHDRVPAIRNT